LVASSPSMPYSPCPKTPPTLEMEFFILHTSAFS